MKRMYVLLIAAVWSLALITPMFSSTCMAQETFKPVTLKYADATPQKSWFGQQHEWWANEVDKRTGGKVKIQIFWMESLVKWKDMLPGVQSGIADLGWISSTYHPSNLPLYLMLDNPFAFRKDYFAAFLALIDTTDNEPNLKAEMEREGIILICPHISGQMQIGSKKPVNSNKDLKGKTIRTYGGGRGKYLEFFGMNPIFMPYSDIYEALDRGTIEAAEEVMMLSQTFKHYEVTKYLYMTNAGGALASGVYMNRKVFNKFPKDIQQMFINLRLEYSERYANGTQDSEVGFYREWETKHGVKIVYPSPEDQKALQEAGQKATEFILAKQDSEGHTGARKVWNYYMTALKKYEDQRAKKK